MSGRSIVFAIFLTTAAAALGAAPKEEGFVSLFNGKDLTGWEGKPGWWRVEEGAITAESTKEKPCEKCTYLFWRGGKPADFELRATFRISGKRGNSGIYFRTRQGPDFDAFGPQADIDVEGDWLGGVYEHAPEHERGQLAKRGQKVVIDENGKKTVTPLGDPADLLKHYKNGDWNDYRVVVRGPEITLEINGVLMCQVTDKQKPAARDGLLALQMHEGPPMKVQFKNIRIKKL